MARQAEGHARLIERLQLTDDLLTRTTALMRHAGLDYGFLAEAYECHALLQGAKASLLVVLSTVVLSLVFGVGLIRLLMSPHKRVRWLAQGFVELTRNTPVLIQLCCTFLVANMLITQTLSQWRLTNPPTPFFWAITLLSLHKATFHTEAPRADTEAIPLAMLETATSLDFSARERLWRVQLSLALRTTWPSLMNNTTELVRASSLTPAIAAGDLTYSALMIQTQRDNVLEYTVLLLLFYGVVTYAVHALGVWIEGRLRMPGYSATGRTTLGDAAHA